MSNNSKSSKSWREKLADNKGLPKVEEITDKMSKRWGTGTVVIPAPKDVDEIMKEVPRGKLITLHEIRQMLARKYGATIGCPITTGIFAWIAAHAAEEEAAEGNEDFTPYWRTLKSGGELNAKYPGGVEGQQLRLEEEGHIIQPGKGKKPPRVKDFEKCLVRL
jgi:alkylated DNA nucleotide flippase Atl1